MKIFLSFGLLFLAVVPSARLQRIVSGPCPSVPAMANFDKSKFLGHWTEVEKSPSVFDFILRCLELDYVDNNDGNLNVIVKGTSLGGLPLTIKGDGMPQQGNKLGKYNVRFGFGVPFQGSESTFLETDYKEFAVIYSCTSSIIQGFYHTEYIWILSRDGSISNPTRQNIYETLDRLKINRVGLQLVDRSTCPTNQTLVTRESEQNLASAVEPVVLEETVTSTLPEKKPEVTVPASE